MSERIALDSHPISLLCDPDLRKPDVVAIKRWVLDHATAGDSFILPLLADYEVRRDLIRAGKLKSVRRLDRLRAEFEPAPVTPDVLLRAAELWAQARSRGQVGAAPGSLDADVIIAASVEAAGATVTATSNPRHLQPFLPADTWRNI